MQRRVSSQHKRCPAPVARALVVFCCLLPAAAFAAYDPARLSELVRDEQYQDAYDYALEHRAAHEGEIGFDLYYGIAAVEVGELNEAVFALERVVAREPGFDRARLELARAYFLQDDDRRARRAFEIVLAHDPPPPVEDRIQRYLTAMDRRADRYETTTSGFVELSIGHDTNVNAATDEESVSIFDGFEVLLSDDSRERDDNFARFEARGRVSHPVAPGINLVGEAGIWQRSLSDESEFDTGAIDGSFGVMRRGSDDRLLVSADLQRFYLDGENYRELLGLGARYDRTLSDELGIDLTGRVSQLEYDDRPELDSTLLLLDAGFSRAFRGGRRPVLNAGVFLGTEDADDDGNAAQSNTERDLLGVRAGLWLALAPRWTLQGRFEYSTSEYAEESDLFGKTREEDYYLAGISADWRPDAHWRVGPHLTHSRNDANIELYEYERTEFWVRARYEFY
ncbi:MAG: porin family protein [Halofilum sp. (in: g-proteobacteria)]|nr:porin family protein [Halofilum sp. (in: g-proteobacteria)]